MRMPSRSLSSRMSEMSSMSLSLTSCAMRSTWRALFRSDLRFGTALEFYHDAHAVAIAFVADVGDVFDVFVVDQLRDALDQAGLIHLIRNFGDDDGFAIFAEGLDGGFGAHHEAAATGAVGFENSSAAVNDAGGREVR